MTTFGDENDREDDGEGEEGEGVKDECEEELNDFLLSSIIEVSGERLSDLDLFRLRTSTDEWIEDLSVIRLHLHLIINKKRKSLYD